MDSLAGSEIWHPRVLLSLPLLLLEGPQLHGFGESIFPLGLYFDGPFPFQTPQVRESPLAFISQSLQYIKELD